MLSMSSPLSMLHEIGMNAIELTVYPEIVGRAMSLFWKHAEDKFEYRWFSGEWQEALPKNVNINIEQCIQPLPEVITKEFELSTEFINITMKLADLRIKIPAPPSIDLRRSCDIVLAFDEISFILASALPRTFLSQDIFDFDGNENNSLPESESDVRIQNTMNGFSIEILPSPLFPSAKEPQKFLYSKAITFLGSYDRLKKNPDEKFYLFLSILLHYVQLNIDFDVLAGGAATLLHYASIYNTNDDNNEKQLLESQQTESPFLSKIPESLTLILRLNLSKIDCRLWRQHVPMSESETQMTTAQVIPILHFDAERIELGIKLLSIRLSQLFAIGEREKIFDCSKIVAGRIGKLRLSTFENSNLSSKTIEGDHKIDAKSRLGANEAEILCLGERQNNENKDIALEFHLRSNNGAKQCHTVTFKLNKSTLRLGNEVDNAVIMMMEAALNPEWFWSSELLKGNSSEEKSDKFNEQSDTQLEKILSIFASDSTLIDSIIIEVQLQDIIVIVPLHEAGEAICMVCESAQLNTGYLKGAISQNDQSDWLTKFQDSASGFHHNLSSRQKFTLLKYDKADKQIIIEEKDLIKSFALKSYLHPLHMEGFLTQCDLSTKQLVALNQLNDTFISYRDRFVKLAIELSTGLASFSREDKHVKKEKLNPSKGPLSIACHTSTVSIESANLLLEEVNESLSSLKKQIGSSFSAKNAELDKMRSQFFLKEKDRFSAFALLTNEASGYIRMGSTSLSHQRIVSTTNFWRYWAVVKKKTLILFTNPSDVSFSYHISYHNVDTFHLHIYLLFI
jgi:hypothetical protein